MKTLALGLGALVIVTVCALELEAWAVRASKETAGQGASSHEHEQGRLIRSHTVEQPTIGIIT